MKYRVCRIQAGITRAKQAALQLGITASYLSQIENDIKKPSRDLQERMAVLYRCSIDALMGREKAAS